MAIAIAAVLGIAVGIVAGVLMARTSGTRTAVDGEQPPSAVADDDVELSLRDAVDHLEIGVLVVDARQVVRFRSAMASQLRGTHVGVILEERIGEILTAHAGGPRHIEVAEFHGPPRSWLELAVDALPEGGSVVTIRDVTERMRIESIRTDFVTNVSHELRTPVGAIAVLAEALLDEDDRAVVDRVATRLVEEAHRAVHTMDDLLALSQIEGMRPGDHVVDLNSVVARAVDRGRAAAVGRAIEVQLLDPPVSLSIRGDDAQLVSAVGNLVENAVKYSHDGGVVQVRTRVAERQVEVMVADDGIGIPARDIDRVFERFYRVDRARSRETGGTGLGLSIVRHVASNHGGEVLVSSQEGEGSTFVLRLPITRLVDITRTGETAS